MSVGPYVESIYVESTHEKPITTSAFCSASGPLAVGAANTGLASDSKV